jgi:hypothetical protein
MLYRCEVIHTSLAAAPAPAVVWLSDMTTWSSWAPWVRRATRTSPSDWTIATDAGSMKVRFVAPNALGVLDHEVTLESGETAFNAMRVIPNGSGSELVMVVFQRPGMSAEEFDRDVRAVTEDLARMRRAAEAID